MGDLRNKAKKLEADAAHTDRWKREREGWTVFHFDLKPQLTVRNLYIGEAIRHLQRVTATRISFWRCPVRGLAIQYKELPTSHYLGHYGETWTMLRFSQEEDVVAAKRELVEDMLLQGIKLYRALPNAVFDEQVRMLVSLLTAPVSIDAPEWLKAKAKLHKRFQTVLETHTPELRAFLLKEPYAGNQIGPVAIGVTPGDRRV